MLLSMSGAHSLGFAHLCTLLNRATSGARNTRRVGAHVAGGVRAARGGAHSGRDAVDRRGGDALVVDAARVLGDGFIPGCKRTCKRE